MAATDAPILGGTSLTPPPAQAGETPTGTNGKTVSASAGDTDSPDSTGFTKIATEPPADSDIIARVGNEEINIGDMRAALLQLDPVKRDEVVHNPANLQEFLRSISLKRVLYKQAISNHWDKDPAVATQIQRASINIVADSYLVSVVKSPDGYPNDAELRAAYDAAKADLLTQRQFHIAQIFIALPKGADKAAENKAQDKLKTVREKLSQSIVSFTEISRQETDDKTLADLGGDMGWINENNLPALIRVQAVALDKLTVSEPILLDDGWHIIKLLETKDQRPLTFEEARGLLVQQLRTQRARADREAYLEKLLQQNPVTIDPQVFSRELSRSGK